MQRKIKLLSSLLAAVMVLMSFSAIASADGAAKLTEGTTEKYAYEYWEDNALWIFPYDLKSEIDLGLLDLEAIEAEDGGRSITRVCIRDRQIQQEGAPVRFFRISGNGCRAQNLNIKCNSDVNTVSVTVSGFPNLSFEDIVMPENVDCSVTLDSELEEVTLPKGNYHLTGDKVKKVIIEEGTEVIDSLMGCTALTDVVIPSSVTYLQYSCFLGCTSLKSIDLPDSIDTIKASSFAETGLESIKIPSAVESVDTYVFRDCKALKTVSIPGKVTEISYYAFDGCKAIKDVYYDGTEAQWNSIKVTDQKGKTLKDVFGDATIHYKGEKQTGWVQEGKWWKYFDENGDPVKSDWLQLKGKWYYFNEEGYMAFDFTKIGNDTYYFKDSGEMVTGWFRYGINWHYFNTNGKMATGWKSIGGKWYFFDNEPDYKASGIMLTGWQQLGGKWYYFDPVNGDMKTGWQKISGKWYYMKSDGAMVKGWQSLGGKWYYFNGNGDMATGWKAISGKWYYMDPANGDMKTGWLKLGSSWYYLKSSGEMATGKVDIGGKTYEFDNSGVWKG